MQQIRRIVTGHDSTGRAVLVSNESVVADDGHHFPLWGGDETPAFPDDGLQPTQASFFPPEGGYRYLVAILPPNGDVRSPDGDAEAVAAEMARQFPGLAPQFESDNPGMHTTDTIDFVWVLSGELVLELDDNVEVELHAGDTVIQNGTRHRWHNRTTEPTVMVVFMVGAHRS